MAEATTNQAKDEPPPDWVLEQEDFQRDVTAWSQGGLGGALDSAFHNVRDVHAWAKLHHDLGPAPTQELLTDLRDLGTELERP